MMNRLNLSPDELRVETFRTEAADAGRGAQFQAITLNTGCDTCYCTSRVNACFCTENLSCRCQ